ncbi:MAG: PBECR2 nuclease fold domain-containing protein [Nitrospiraceae bacterium]
MAHFPCPYLGGDVELTDERKRHIDERHPDLFEKHQSLIEETLVNPDQVRRSSRSANARLFIRDFGTISDSAYVVVVVVSESAPSARHWVVTAYRARRLTGGVHEWKRN